MVDYSGEGGLRVDYSGEGGLRVGYSGESSADAITAPDAATDLIDQGLIDQGLIDQGNMTQQHITSSSRSGQGGNVGAAGDTLVHGTRAVRSRGLHRVMSRRGL